MTITGFIDNVIHKSGLAKATGKPYSFYQLEVTAEDGKEYKIATNDAAWQARIGGPHTLELNVKVNGKYTNYSLVEKPIYSAKVTPVAQAAKAQDNFQLQVLEALRIIEQKIDNLKVERGDSKLP